MGKYVAQINNTYIEYGDYEWDYIKQNKPKEYYNNAKIDASIYDDCERTDIEIPIEELVDIKVVRKNYKWEWSNKKSLHRWLFNYIKNRGESIRGSVYVRLHAGNLNYDKPLIYRYYLQSDIGDDNIIITTKKKIHEIKNYEDFEWLRLRFLSVEY